LSIVSPRVFTKFSATEIPKVLNFRIRDAFATVLLKTDALVLLPVYSAGEDPLPEITHTHLAAHLRSLGHPAVFDVADPAAAAETLKTIAHAGDMIVCMGAGNITAFAHQLPELL
jgi:UDP-N-acetylmuramate--alanine ligase